MSKNVYLGADLSPAIGAPDLATAIDGAGEIYNEIERTDFTERAIPLGKEIANSKADLVGLQEVALWRVQMPSDGGWEGSGGIGAPAMAVKYDFLDLLMDAIGKAGGKYKVVGVQEEFDAELPSDIDDNDATGNEFLSGADLDARLTMRDVILVRKGSKVKAKKKSLKMGHFDELFSADVGGVEITAKRGWLSVQAKYKKNKKTKPNKFTFVNTHLEAFGDPTIREAQAKELVAKGGPANVKGQVVLVGDINSGLQKPHNILGDDQLAYKALQKFGFEDNGTVQTCCYPSMLNDPSYVFDHTVDHIFTLPGGKLKKGSVTGDDPGEMTPSGLWPSDHGGVIGKLKLKR